MLLFAGYDSVADAIDLGTLLLLTNVDQREAIVRDPRLVNTAVEEILRAAERGGPGLPPTRGRTSRSAASPSGSARRCC